MRFTAWDSYCEDKAQSVLTINVTRNLSPPRWLSNSANITILETQETGESIYNLSPSASDPDIGVSQMDINWLFYIS